MRLGSRREKERVKEKGFIEVRRLTAIIQLAVVVDGKAQSVTSTAFTDEDACKEFRAHFGY